jgi:hypothetical protein
MNGPERGERRNTRKIPARVKPNVAIWAVLLAVGVAGCKGKQGRQPAGGEALASRSVTTDSAAASTPSAGVLPPPVEQAEALAEDVQDDLSRNAWPAAEAKLRELGRVGEKLDSAGVAQTERMAYGAALDSLDGAIARRNRADALRAGNRVSRIVTGIMAGYPTKVPADVGLMDVAGRDALYAAQQGRWNDAANAAAEIGRSYATVQAHVRARDPALDRRVTAELTQLERAAGSRARDRAVSLAQALLEDVDRIEQAF